MMVTEINKNVISKPSIVLADADAASLTSLQDAFADRVFITYLKDGREAVNFLKEHTPDLVFVADVLPSLSGKQLINGMRFTQHLKDVPTVLLSEQELVFKDATKVLRKPLHLPDLVSIAQDHLDLANDSFEDQLSENHILVVEDNETVSALLRHLLTREGFLMSDAVTAPEGKEIIHERLAEFDLIMLDLNLPGGTGFELLQLIRERSQVPVIVLSALRQNSNIEKSLALGAQDFMAKPFNPGELVLRIKHHLNLC